MQDYRPQHSTFDIDGFLFATKWVCVLAAFFFVGKAGLMYYQQKPITRTIVAKSLPKSSVIDSAAKIQSPWLDKPQIKLNKKVGLPGATLSSKNQISAESFLIADLDTGQVLASRAPADTLPIASLSKLMTAFTAIRYGAPSPVQELFYPLLMESSNAAANQIVDIYDGPADSGIFISRMNHQAALLDMTHTTFADPSGISSQNVSTAYDLLLLAKGVRDLTPAVLDITKTREKTVLLKNTVAGDATYRDLQNINLFTHDPRFLGGKTGYTSAAGETLISIFRLPIANLGKSPENQRNIVFILLGSDKREKDFGILMKWLELATKA